MGSIISLSVSPEDLAYLKENPSVSPSKLFREALKLQRRVLEFYEMYKISDYYERVLKLQEHIGFMSKEILRREERIESLQDVLAQKEVAERRIRELDKKSDNAGSGAEHTAQ